MRRFLILPCLLFCGTAAAQRIDSTQYAYPILGTARLYSANFGEIRSGHFHAGIDFKTDGTTGHKIIAVADGYISRVTMSPGGYGRALYLTLNNGRTAVYGHLERFGEPIESLVHAERCRLRTNSVDLRFEASEHPVRKHDVIAYSGNSGSSFGPHLHYELRDTKSQQYLNIVKQGIISPTDKLPPRILKIHYLEVDSVQGVCLTAPVESYTAVRSSSGKYRLTHTTPIGTGRKGYFIAEVTDRREGVNNTFGIWRLRAWIDGRIFYEYRMDGFSPGQSRFSDAVSCFPLQNNSRNEVIRLARMTSVPECFYPAIEERGIVRTSPGQVRRIRLEAEDDRGNSSSIEFDIKGRPEEFRATPRPGSTALHPAHPAHVGSNHGIRAEIPSDALFESAFCRPEQHDQPVRATPGVVPLTPVYRLFDTLTPLRRTARISIRTQAPGRLLLRAVLARRTPQGTLLHIGGRYSDGTVTANTRFLGEMLAVADTLPPRIRPLFADSVRLTKNNSLRFSVSDNFSGITSYALHIDSVWVPCERFPMQGTLIHTFDKPAEGRFHTVRLSVSDGCGNTEKWEGTFYR